ncbi:hypothetical protein B0T25DRAFT_576175 [Lasiosphaeria hispida]|uniref:Uncharacterized protein n=1 Tax=Lasiosphaeria hispida TaxID=260671 RepID=A0AAJ0HVK6_9PEZI|nr:hypothetical protein B0T25DRAFT_576175 [Lasiosphaeria hispida]
MPKPQRLCLPCLLIVCSRAFDKRLVVISTGQCTLGLVYLIRFLFPATPYTHHRETRQGSGSTTCSPRQRHHCPRSDPHKYRITSPQLSLPLKIAPFFHKPFYAPCNRALSITVERIRACDDKLPNLEQDKMIVESIDPDLKYEAPAVESADKHFNVVVRMGDVDVKTKGQLDGKAITDLVKTMTESTVASTRTKMLSAGLAGALFATPFLVTGIAI